MFCKTILLIVCAVITSLVSYVVSFGYNPNQMQINKGWGKCQ